MNWKIFVAAVGLLLFASNQASAFQKGDRVYVGFYCTDARLVSLIIIMIAQNRDDLATAILSSELETKNCVSVKKPRSFILIERIIGGVKQSDGIWSIAVFPGGPIIGYAPLFIKQRTII